MAIKVYVGREKFEDCTFVTGFHGIGFTGYWSIKYLIQQLKAERIGFVESVFAPPICTVSSGRIVTPFELYQKGNLVFFKAEVAPPREREYQFFTQLGEWVTASGFKEACLIGGLDSTLKNDDTTYRIVYTSKYTLPDTLKDSIVLEDDRLIVGPIAILLNHFEAVGFPAFSILAYAAQNRLDPRACAEAITVISRVYNFEVDLKPLIAGAEAIEEALAKPPTKEERGEKALGTFYS
ncbi:MAG: proteasome assembly chaperone family protein [Nitrososphaeria archaeon]